MGVGPSRRRRHGPGGAGCREPRGCRPWPALRIGAGCGGRDRTGCIRLTLCHTVRVPRPTAPRAPARRGSIEVSKTLTIARSPAEVYAFWRNLENLPRFMAYLDSVRVLDDRRSAWKAKGPIGSQYEWQAVDHRRPAGGADRVALHPSVGLVQHRQREVHPGSPRSGNRGARRASVCAARRPARRGDRQALRPGTRPAGDVRPAPAQAGARGGGGDAFRREHRGRTPSSQARGRARRAIMKANCWDGKRKVRVETVPDPEILNRRDAIVKDHLDGDLRFGPAPLQRLHPDDGEGRHPRPRVHGRGGGGGARTSRI